MLLLLAILPFQFAALYFTMRRSGFIPFPHVLLIYIIGCQLSIFLVSSGTLKYSFLVTYSTYSFALHYVKAQLFFASIFFLSFASFMPPSNLTFFTSIQRLLKSSVKISVGDKTLLTAITVFWLYHIVLFITLRWALVWENGVYLLMSNEGILLYPNAITKFLLAIFPLIGLLIFVTLSVLSWRSKAYAYLLLVPLAAFDLMYWAGAHSRKAVLFLIVYSSLSYIVQRKRVTLVLGSLGAFIILISSLGGRVLPTHGISTLFSPAQAISSYFSRSFSFAFLNIFEGGFSTTELFNRMFQYPLKYKLLSFSPLPNFLDGFGQIRDSAMQKLGPYTPPSAIFEVWSFGLPYIVLFALTQVVAGRLVIRLLINDGASFAAIIVNVAMAYATYMEFSYPLRNVYRIFILIIIVCLVVQHLSGRRSPERNSRVRRAKHRPSLPKDFDVEVRNA